MTVGEVTARLMPLSTELLPLRLQDVTESDFEGKKFEPNELLLLKGPGEVPPLITNV